MRKSVLSVLSLLTVLATANPYIAAADSGPQPYNYVRIQGTATGNYNSTTGNYGALEIQMYDGRHTRVECPTGSGTSLGCLSVSNGDQLTVYAHMQHRSTCAYDGYEAFIVVNLIYRFNTSTGTWQLLTS